MKILALDSSGIVASVAVVEDDTLLAEYTVNYKKTHSQTLLPMLDEIVKMTELELESIDAIAVAALGSIYYKEGRTQTDVEHVPEYLRVSQAERERAEREKAQKQAGTTV